MLFRIKITPEIILCTHRYLNNSISGRTNNVRLIFDCIFFLAHAVICNVKIVCLSLQSYFN